MLRRICLRFSNAYRTKIPKAGKHTISLSKFHHDIGGFILYDNPTNKYRNMSLIFLCAIGYMAAIAYFIPDP